MRVLITGATGFVGNAIVREFLQKKIDVYGVGSGKTGNKTDLQNFYQADIRKIESVNYLEKVGKIDAIIHAAGLAHQFAKITKEDFWKTNVEGTKNIGALGVKLNIRHFILISSVSVYGKKKVEKENSKNKANSKFINESCICLPDSIYAQSKLESENAALEICEKHQIPLTILRLATVIGEGDQGNVSRLINAIDRKRFVWIGSGENYKSLIYKNDVARACCIVLNKKREETEIFNITAEPITMSEIVEQITLHLQRKIPKLTISATLLKKIFQINANFFRFKKIENLSDTIDKWLSEECFSGEMIKKEYGFYADTSIVEAIGRQTEYYKRQK